MDVGKHTDAERAGEEIPWTVTLCRVIFACDTFDSAMVQICAAKS
jgi:hypothetical protein